MNTAIKKMIARHRHEARKQMIYWASLGAVFITMARIMISETNPNPKIYLAAVALTILTPMAMVALYERLWQLATYIKSHKANTFSVMVIFTILTLAPTESAHGMKPVEQICRVEVCNKISRFSLSPWSHIKDKMGETCFEVILPKSEAHEGNVLDSESRWYQGKSLNPTKKSVTKVKRVYECEDPMAQARK